MTIQRIKNPGPHRTPEFLGVPIITWGAPPFTFFVKGGFVVIERSGQYRQLQMTSAGWNPQFQ